MTPIERTLRIATTVPDLPAAWTFVMAHIDELGSAPSIEINPTWASSDADDWTKTYTVVLSGTTGGPLT